MEILKLSDLIGQEIVDLSYHYIPENEFGMQSFHSFILLSSGSIIAIPKFDDNDYLLLTDDNLSYFKEKFSTGDLVKSNHKKQFAGHTIVDFYFTYYDNEIDLDTSSYIKLSNGYYLTENNYGPVGITTIDLVILTEEEFIQQTSEKDVRSFLSILL